MTSFVAIDFETANYHRSSVCSVGVVIVENAIITGRLYELIQPNPHFYADWATDIHGLDYWATKDAKAFPDVWGPIAERTKGLPFVAHNSSFDESCLKAVHELYEMAYQGYEFHCTYRTAKRLFPNLPDHKLPTVAAHFGFSLDAHHNALADAEACAHIAMALLKGN